MKTGWSGHEPSSERSEVRVGVDGDDAVAAQEREQRAEDRGEVRLAHAALR